MMMMLLRRRIERYECWWKYQRKSRSGMSIVMMFKIGGQLSTKQEGKTRACVGIYSAMGQYRVHRIRCIRNRNVNKP